VAQSANILYTGDEGVEHKTMCNKRHKNILFLENVRNKFLRSEVNNTFDKHYTKLQTQYILPQNEHLLSKMFLHF